MGRRWCLILIALGLAGLVEGQDPVPVPEGNRNESKVSPPSDKITFADDVAPFLATYCTSCHGGPKPKASLALDVYKSEAAALQARNAWDRVFQRVRNREMPPPTRPQPSPEEVERVTRWAKALLVAEGSVRRDPGRVTMRRLNRAEYNNTIRDLVGIAFAPADDFPADDVGNGFDNMGDVLTLPPLLMEKYLAAAEKIASQALADAKARARIFICRPNDNSEREDCARKILEAFAQRAYRRPLGSGELDRLVGFVKLAESQGDSFEEGIKLAVEAVLVSPHFLFRVERERKSTTLDEAQSLNDFELATRMSYFLWSTMPDEDLFTLAKKGTLRQELTAQVKRMLRAPQARALGDNFASQWLQTRNLTNAAPDPGRFPSFDKELRAAMQNETELFFETVVKEDRSLLDFLDADFTFANERLARHYGIGGVKGEEFRRVSLVGTPRGGVLTQGSILTLTSNPTRTSPVKRGKWILENILGTPPPPPPPNAGELKEDQGVELTGTLRQRLEQHRANPDCASCHQRMDPLGFGLENFDAIGSWRTQDGAFPIDPSGTLPGGQTFQGPRELRAVLLSKKEEFTRCLTEKMLAYSLGRGLEAADCFTVDQIVGTLAENDYKFSCLVLEIVQSDPFQKRRIRRGDP